VVDFVFEVPQPFLRPADIPTMKTCLLVSALLVCALLFSAAARADAIPFAYSGPDLSVSGTFFGSDNGNDSWTIAGIDATYNSLPVSDIVATGLDPRFLYNNLYYDPGHAPNAVDYYGILFNVPGLGDVNLCTDNGSGGGCGSGGYASILWNGSSYQLTQVDFSQLSQSNAGSPTPEPSTFVLLGGGLAAAGAFTRRYLRR
jgi:hypothetical protein